MAQRSNFGFRKNIPILSNSDFNHSHSSKILGSGAYGLVQTVSYRGSICAAKTIHSTLIEHVREHERRRVIENFLNECERCKNITHTNIVEFYGVYYPPEQSGQHSHDIPTHYLPVMILELMDKSLNAYMMENKPKDIALEVKSSILQDVATGLSYLHKLDSPMIHRDLTPTNILLKLDLSKGKKLWIAKIADLGVSKVIDADSKVKYSQAPGCVAFMPPEALEENPHYTTSLDVFSFGGVVLFVATHEWPSPEDSNGSISEVERRRTYLDKMIDDMKKLKPLVEACLSNNPKLRPSTEEVLRKIKDFADKDYYVEYDFGEEVGKPPKLGLRKSGPSKDDLALLLDPKPSPAPASYHHTEDDWYIKQTCDKPFETTYSYKQYVGCISSNDAEKMLKEHFDGTYLVREKKECKKTYEICVKYKKPHHIDISINHYFYITDGKKFTTINDLINHYEDHSLVHCFSHINTKLKCPYYVVIGSQRKRIKSPWSIPQSLPPSIGKSPVDSGEKLYNHATPEIQRKKKSRISRIADVLRRKQSHKIPLEEELWYHGEISRANAERLIENDGDCLVRYSNNQERHVLTAKWDSVIKHFVITQMYYQGECAYGFHGADGFSSITELLTHYIENQISVHKYQQFYLKQPVCKQITVNEQCPINHHDIIFDDKPIEVERSGRIYFATIKHSCKRVTIKTCYSHQFHDQQQFLQEANIIRQLKHSNIVTLLSVCDDEKPVYMVLEMMRGNFLQFLHELGDNLTTHQLTSFLLDAAMGMEYLTSKNYIHRNLSARSCMVKLNADVLKIFDFSMCTKVNGLFLMEDDESNFISIKWAAPEVFAPGIYTSACDVWSYGVLMYEAYSLGQAPFYGMDNRDVLRKVQQGHRLNPPEGTPKAVRKDIMMACWDTLPRQRPTFQNIVIKLGGILAKLPKNK